MPKCFNTFLSEFVTEINDLITNGVSIDGVALKIRIKGFIMDAPATA